MIDHPQILMFSYSLDFLLYRRRSMTHTSCSLPPLGPCGLTLSASSLAFLVVVSSSEVYQGTWPGKAVVRWSKLGSWDPEPGSWNPEPRGGRAAVFSALRQGFFAEQLQWNSTSTQRRSIHLAIRLI
ncbi:hypothetical protein F2Q69_00024237 [Brassica cretica]|uniref:Uncharacterized protein n=1 Tax=Brassica cretica TaxID=69181 RepID=A0A8S9Q803_BRACR|nr:hypothetical protein F2Q69_00024237 [Brassica cretica]